MRTAPAVLRLRRPTEDLVRVGASMIKTIKNHIGPGWHFRARRLSRLRWLAKYRLMRRYKTDVSHRGRVAYVLLDPEIESFSYRVENTAEVIAGLAAALGHPPGELAGYAAETQTDPELNELLARHLRWRLEATPSPPLGHRLAWYLIVRARKPEVVVETGIYLGLGSLVLLHALERNRREGSPGELLSFDLLPGAGSAVREAARGGWRRIIGSTHDVLLPALEGRRVDMLFHDTSQTEENQRMEFEAALSHAAPSLLLLDAHGGISPTLQAICAERNGAYHRVPLRSRDHIHPGVPITFGIFDREDGALRPK